MKDLDFDELDRAVNSLMSDVPKTASPPKPVEDVKTLDITPTLSDHSTPSFAKLNEETAKVTQTPTPLASPNPTPVVAPSEPTAPSLSSQSPLATRRGGRFMDVVHPSSDMKKPTVPPRSGSRQGMTIEPRADMTTPTPEDTPAPSVESIPAPATPVANPEVEPSTLDRKAPASDWPDPLEMANFKSEPEEPKNDEKPLPESTLAPAEPPKIDEPTPLSSPFLPDTKVEKRPLGQSTPAVSGEEKAEPDHTPVLGENSDKKGTTENPNAQLPAAPAETDAPLPEELQGDLMAVEADTSGIMPQKEEELLPATTETKEEKKPKHTPAPTPVEAHKTPSEPTGPTSIPQQYHEEPSTGDQENGAIYDTDTYHQPLAHPAKKKSGWLWVIWILIILLVGAGGGAAVYFLGLV